MNRVFQEFLMRSCTLLLCATFLLSGILHDRVHHTGSGGAPATKASEAGIISAAHASGAIADHNGGEFCPICAGLLQFFLADGQVDVPLTFATAEEPVCVCGIAPSATPFFHQPRAPPAFSC